MILPSSQVPLSHLLIAPGGVDCKFALIILKIFFYNCFLQSNLLSLVTFLILSFLDILEDLLRASISVASIRLLLFSVSLHVSEPYNKLLLINAL
jgi:hypothetical protein